MREQRLYARNQLLAVEQLADGHGGIEGAGVAIAPCPRAQVGIEVGRRGDAAGEGAARASISTASVEGNTLKPGAIFGGFARISHVARRILQSDDTRAERAEQALRPA